MQRKGEKKKGAHPQNAEAQFYCQICTATFETEPAAHAINQKSITGFENVIYCLFGCGLLVFACTPETLHGAKFYLGSIAMVLAQT